MESLQEAKAIAKILDNRKALNVRVIKIADISSLADYMVIATGNSSTHVKSLADYVEYEMDERKLVISLYGIVVGPRCFAVRSYLAQDDARQRAGNRRVDEPLRRCELALNQCEVLAVEELAFAAARRQLVLNLRDLGDEDEAGCVAVEPVHGMVGVVLAVRSVPI